MDQKEHAAKDHNRAKQRHAITARHPAHRIAFQCVTCPDFKIFSFLCHILIQPLFGLPPVHAVQLADQDVRFLFYLISPFPAFCLRDVSSPRIGRGVYMIRVPSAQIEFLLHLPEESYANQETELHSFPGFFDPHGFHHTDRKHDLLLFCRITAMNVCICRADHLLPCKCIQHLYPERRLFIFCGRFSRRRPSRRDSSSRLLHIPKRQHLLILRIFRSFNHGGRRGSRRPCRLRIFCPHLSRSDPEYHCKRNNT